MSGRFVAMLVGLMLNVGLAGPLAAESPLPPDQAIRVATENLLTVVEQARGYYDADPERYYAEVDRIIGPLVDFGSFSRGVMGRWGSRGYYDSLTDADKAAFRARVERFSSTFREGLIRTYSKGLLAFSGETIEVMPANAEEIVRGSATVEQRIHGEADQPYVIRYKMKRGSDGLWQVRNVSLDSLNLGKVYQNQFASAAGKYKGDIDQVIDNWTVGSAETTAAK